MVSHHLLLPNIYTKFHQILYRSPTRSGDLIWNDPYMSYINLLFTGLDLLGHQDKRKNSMVDGNFHITLCELQEAVT